MIFLFVCSTPPRRRLWLHHAVRSLLERRLSELRATFPMNVSCHVAICFSMLGISKKTPPCCLICDVLIFHFRHADA